MRALFYLEDKLVAEEFYKCQQWKGGKWQLSRDRYRKRSKTIF